MKRLDVVRWTEATLPPGLPALLHEAERTGHKWMRDFSTEWAVRSFTADGEALFLAFDAGLPIGMAVISADPHVDDHETGRLRYIYVSPAFRRRGLLRLLVEACLERGWSRWRRLRLHTDNPIAARCYERYGFQPVRTEHRSTHVMNAGL